jgi:LacI family transcriptional regulator
MADSFIETFRANDLQQEESLATIVDVARIANVSLSTVSHVVNGTRPVSAATRYKVQLAIAETGYEPHGVARALRRARTDTVGLVVSDTGQPVFAEMVRGIEHEARAAGFTLLLANSAEDVQREAESIQALRERRVDGLLVAQVAGSDHSLVDQMRQLRTPLVLIDRLTAPGVDQVGVENHEPMRQLVGHLIGRGHQRVAYVAGDTRVPVLAERMQGYLGALAANGIRAEPGLIIEGTVHEDDTSAAVRPVLLGRDRPTALVAASMVISMGSLRAIGDARLRVPDELAFAVFDEPAFADLFHPRLTSVVQPAFSIGREAMRLLLRRLKRPEAPARTVRLRPRIVHRESCGCPTGLAAEWEVMPNSEQS